MYKTLTNCRFCDGELETILFLGDIYPSNFVKEQENLFKAPLTLAKCKECNLVQLKDEVELDSMYRQYWYKSSLNASMLRDLRDVVHNIEQRIQLNSNDIVVDIGCNDGSMFQYYSVPDLRKVGFDPALNLREEASGNCTHFVNDYFSGDSYPYTEKAKVVTSIAMFYDLPDPGKFIKDVKSILEGKGIWVIQLTDLLSMFESNAFDNICHEHLEYYSLEVLSKMMVSYGLQIWDVQKNKVNGASIRVYVSFHGAYEPTEAYHRAMQYEMDYMNKFDDPFKHFADSIKMCKYKLVEFIKQMSEKGRRTFVLGASTKGNTLLQYYGLDKNIISYAAEINKDKYWKTTVGTNIPIIPEAVALEIDIPDYFLILPWHFIRTFEESEKFRKYIENGGSLIVPLPIPGVLDKYGWHYL